MRRRARAARLLFIGAALAVSGAVVVGFADDGSSASPERRNTPITRATAPEPEPESETTTTTPPAPPRTFHDLGLPPLPPLPTLTPDAALDAVDTGSGAVAVFGDSLALQAWPYIDAIADHAGRALAGSAYGGAALCDWFPILEQILRDDAPETVVLAFAGNNLTPCVARADGSRAWGEELVANYVRDATHAIELALAAGAGVTLVGPPDMGVQPQATHALLLREAFERLAGELGVTYVDGAAALSPAGYEDTLPCLPFETAELGCSAGRITVREDDDVHLAGPNATGYSSGAWRYATLLLAP